MEIIKTSKAPAAIGPYCQAVKTGDLIFCSGQLGIDPRNGRFAGEDVKAQAEQVMQNLEAVLKAAGLGLSNVVKTTIFLADMTDFSVVNDVYANAFAGHKPARATVQVSGLPLGGLVEIECIACCDNA
jgi:2-iminobutanoate/2-iminopropanoate deaminase